MKIQGLLMAGLFALAILAGCATPPESDATTGTGAGAATDEPAKTDESAKSGEAALSDEKPLNPEEVAKEATASTAAAGAAPAAPGGSPKAGEEVAVLETAMGRIIFKFRPDKAPKHVENFKTLAKAKFYDGTRFHRCMANFMIQGGDPNSKDLAKAATWGQGGNVKNGQEVNVPLEPSDLSHKRGVVSMARSQDPNSASSQFFIVQGDSTFLDREYTAFGEVVSGMEAVDKIVATGDPNPQANGAVEPDKAVVVKTIRIAKWPVK